MRRRNRDINVFNLSMLDVISGALGTFLLLVAVLIPWYKKPLAEENRQLRQRVNELEAALEQTRSERDQARTRHATAVAERDQARSERDQARADNASANTALDQARRERDSARNRAQELERRLSKTFLVMIMKWPTANQDVDLHVVDPSGAEFYFSAKTIAGRPGELTEDDTQGPGHEIWSIQQAPPGEYKIYYNLFARKGNSRNPVVTGRIFYRDGTRELPAKRLTEESRKVLVTTLIVAPDGQVTFR